MNGYMAYFQEDNQAMIRVIETGRNPTKRHLGRVHRVATSWLHERLGIDTTKDPGWAIDIWRFRNYGSGRAHEGMYGCAQMEAR